MPSHLLTFLPLLASHVLAFFLPRRHCSFLILAQPSHLALPSSHCFLPSRSFLALLSLRRSRNFPMLSLLELSCHSRIVLLHLRGFRSTLLCRCHDGSLRTAIIGAFWPFPIELLVWFTLLLSAESLQQLA
jgi:hypothetical protein